MACAGIARQVGLRQCGAKLRAVQAAAVARNLTRRDHKPGVIAVHPARLREQASQTALNDPDKQDKQFYEFMEWAKAQGRR